jgi:hypothetical protein
MNAPDSVTAERPCKSEGLAADNSETEIKRRGEVIRARLFGPVKFESGLPTQFLRG